MDVRTAPHALAVHLVDRWIDSVGGGPPGIDPIGSDYAALAAMTAVPPGPLHVLLEGLIETTRAAWGRPSVAVGTALLAYGRRLYHEGTSPLASDVYETFARYARAMGGDERLPDAYLRLGVALRVEGRFDAAVDAYAMARDLGLAAGDRRVGWLARIGAANVARMRRDLRAAAEALDAVIAEVGPVAITVAGGEDVLARAMHDRGAVALDAGQRDQAVVLFYRALERYTDPQRRERVMHDLALAFVELGMLDAGRDALLVLSASASEPYVRRLADANLMWIAALAGHETVFERYRRALGEQALTGELAAQYQASLAEGERRFGRGVATAVPARESAVPLQVALVVHAVREMRAVAGVG